MTPDPHHPITDVDAPFTATLPKDTSRVIEALRNEGVYFDVTINGPKGDPGLPSYDIFWFRKEDDQDKLGRIVKKALGIIRREERAEPDGQRTTRGM